MSIFSSLDTSASTSTCVAVVVSFSVSTSTFVTFSSTVSIADSGTVFSSCSSVVFVTSVSAVPNVSLLPHAVSIILTIPATTSPLIILFFISVFPFCLVFIFLFFIFTSFFNILLLLHCAEYSMLHPPVPRCRTSLHTAAPASVALL